MKTEKRNEYAVENLLGRALYGVTFLHDYMQLLFDDYSLIYYSLPAIRGLDHVVVHWPEERYPALLRDLIGKRVTRTFLEGEVLEVEIDGVVISAALGDASEAHGPESVTFQHLGRVLCVW